MKWLLRKCPNCKAYTMKQDCPKCGARTVSPQPSRFSPRDKYARFRQPEKPEN